MLAIAYLSWRGFATATITALYMASVSIESCRSLSGDQLLLGNLMVSQRCCVLCDGLSSPHVLLKARLLLNRGQVVPSREWFVPSRNRP